MNNINILGCGYAHPSNAVSNYDLESIVETSHDWIVQRTGIENRYISEDENTSDLAYQASLQALKNHQIDRSTIDCIIVATMTPDYITPSVACLVRDRLGLDQHVLCFDVNGACSGFIYALQVAKDLLNSYQRILIIGSETLSKIVDFTDRNTCVLFGDGAGAMIIEKGSHEILQVSNAIEDSKHVLYADGLKLTKGLSNQDVTPQYLKMEGTDVFRFAIKVLEETITELLSQSNKTIDEIDCIIPHQANYRIIKHVAKKLDIPMSKFFIDVQEFGNTSAASVPIAYADAVEKKRITHDSCVMLIGFGAGLTYGGVLIK